jgi:hypothetical protein
MSVRTLRRRVLISGCDPVRAASDRAGLALHDILEAGAKVESTIKSTSAIVVRSP